MTTTMADGKPSSNGATATTSKKADGENSKKNVESEKGGGGGGDDEARLKEILIKKKVMQKKNRRQSGGAPAAAGEGGGAPSNGKKGDVKKEGASKSGKKDDGRSSSNKKEEGNNNNKKHPNSNGSSNAKKGDDNDSRGKKRRRHKPSSRHGERGGPPDNGSRGGGPPDGRGGGDDRGGPGPGREGRGGGRGPSPRGGGDYYRGGPPPPGDYHHRGDTYGRGPPPPPRDYYDDHRRGGGGGWGDDRRGGGGWRDEPPPRGGYDRRGGGGHDYWERGGPGGGRPMGRRDDRDIYGRSGPPPPPQRGGGGSGPVGGGGGPPAKQPPMDAQRSRSGSISSRSYSRSPSRSYSRSRSRSRSRSAGSRSYSRSRSSRSRSYSRSPSRSYSRSPSRESGKRKRSSESHGSRSSKGRAPRSPTPEVDESTKDARTIFVSQLVMRADERDIGRYFSRKVGTRVRDVILLRDKRTGRHKGCAYVELGSLEDVQLALGATGKTPDFQRFPILIKETEAEKNAIAAAATFIPPTGATVNHGGAPISLTPEGKRIEAQKVYVGSIDRCVTQAQLYALFSQFGTLDKVLLQMDMSTGMSRGFAFLSYRDPKDANLAIQTMSGQMLAGRPLKTGWANQQASAAGVVEIKSDQFPDDMNEKIQKVNAAMQQLTGTSLTTMIGQVDPTAQQALLAAGPAGALGIMPTEQLASVADAALDMALGVAPTATALATTAATAAPTMAAPAVVADAKVVGRSDNPTQHILVHNMFDKDEETEKGWEEDIKLDFEEECAQYGKITSVIVMSKDVGGKIYASFETVEGATSCAKNLAGRWFDKRQLRVEFVDSIPTSS